MQKRLVRRSLAPNIYVFGRKNPHDATLTKTDYGFLVFPAAALAAFGLQCRSAERGVSYLAPQPVLWSVCGARNKQPRSAADTF